jgi:hypothetical protein
MIFRNCHDSGCKEGHHAPRETQPQKASPLHAEIICSFSSGSIKIWMVDHTVLLRQQPFSTKPKVGAQPATLGTYTPLFSLTVRRLRHEQTCLKDWVVLMTGFDYPVTNEPRTSNY